MFHAHKSQQGFGGTEIVEKERAGVALKERERKRMGGKKKKTNPAPLLERQQIQSSPAESFLQSPLCFIFLPSHLLRIPSHSFKFFSRTRPLPPLSTHAPRAEQEEAALEGSAAAAAALSPLLAKSGGPEAATNSSQLLRIRWAKQHASCTSLLGAEPGEWGRGRRVGKTGGGWAQTEGPHRPRARPLHPAARVSWPPPLPGAADDLHGGKGCADAAGPRGRLRESRLRSWALVGS